ncbi:MAG: DUF1003 domain-containing protein [Acidobacteria bacterium]|nr:MAG: DUF1003 domain-containing protein [Acidobacteriota bacterium]
MQDSHPIISDLAKLDAVEQAIIHRFIHRQGVARDLTKTQPTFGQRVADRVASFGGSWSFIMIAVAAIAAWVLFNARGAAFDPYPFILLNLILSCTAALQAPIIMMSQNRQAARDRADAQHDYEVNLKAEMEIVALHTKLDEIREEKWTELIKLQQRQLELLAELAGPRRG